MIRLRFVTGTDRLSALIRFQAGICVPFTPSHVECVSQDGIQWIGQHYDGGMQARPADYDAKTRLYQKFVDLPCTEAQTTAFYASVNWRIGTPYDWKSIIDFVDPALNLHLQDHLICSAEMVYNLRARGCEYFPFPLTVPFHHISPRDLFLITSSHVEIDH